MTTYKEYITSNANIKNHVGAMFIDNDKTFYFYDYSINKVKYINLDNLVSYMIEPNEEFIKGEHFGASCNGCKIINDISKYYSELVSKKPSDSLSSQIIERFELLGYKRDEFVIPDHYLNHIPYPDIDWTIYDDSINYKRFVPQYHEVPEFFIELSTLKFEYEKKGLSFNQLTRDYQDLIIRFIRDTSLKNDAVLVVEYILDKYDLKFEYLFNEYYKFTTNVPYDEFCIDYFCFVMATEKLKSRSNTLNLDVIELSLLPKINTIFNTYKEDNKESYRNFITNNAICYSLHGKVSSSKNCDTVYAFKDNVLYVLQDTKVMFMNIDPKESYSHYNVVDAAMVLGSNTCSQVKLERDRTLYVDSSSNSFETIFYYYSDPYNDINITSLNEDTYFSILNSLIGNQGINKVIIDDKLNTYENTPIGYIYSYVDTVNLKSIELPKVSVLSVNDNELLTSKFSLKELCEYLDYVDDNVMVNITRHLFDKHLSYNDLLDIDYLSRNQYDINSLKYSNLAMILMNIDDYPNIDKFYNTVEHELLKHIVFGTGIK